MAEFVNVAQVSDLQPGTGKVITVKDKAIALFNVDGTFYAIDNTCLHRGGPLGEGELEECVVTCPWHGWQFNIKTGVSETNPSAKVKTYEVKTEGSAVMISV
ncbi:MAG: non-heme iron oxygenase ferredoxin subunit [Nitrospira sp.]|nr:non-heme iron oxygenase ferredoxin subunit [Nitrospira sp.]